MRGSPKICAFIVAATLVSSRAWASGGLFVESKSRHDFAETVTKLGAALKRKGWKVPAIHDLQAAMRKSGRKVRPVKVFAACHPGHAVKILSRDSARQAAAMMPCRIAVYEKRDGATYISRPNITLMARLMDRASAKVMMAAGAEIEAILKPLVAK